ncbi:MAG: ABC transporter substrate-binding protein [bacterium]
MKKVVFLLAFALIFSLAFGANYNTGKGWTPSVGVPGGTYREASIEDPKTFNPIYAQETSSTAVLNYLFEGLTRFDANSGEMVPEIAESWSYSEDGLTWTFKLRRDVRWSDGTPLTADDVLFTYNDVHFNENVQSPAIDIYLIEGEPFKVEKVDDYTFKIITPKPFAPLLYELQGEILPKHIMAKAVEEGTIKDMWGIRTPPKEIVGNGPFVIKEYIPSQKVVLERNPYYYKRDDAGNRLPYVDRVEIFIVPDTETEFLKFKNGEIDAYSLTGDKYPILKPLEKEKDFTIYNSGPTFGSTFLTFNQNPNAVKPPKLDWFTDANFRRAVAHCIDKESMIENIFEGLAYPQDAALSSGFKPYFNPNVRKYEYDLEKAKEILEKAGYKDRDGDGVREDKNGNRVEFTIVTNVGNKPREQMGLMIQEDLKKVGIKANFSPIDFNALVERLTKTYDWEALLIGLTGVAEPHAGSNVWQSSGHLHVWNPRQKEPATDWEAQIDELFDRGAVTLDREKRIAIYHKWQEIAAEQVPLIYTVNVARLQAVKNKFGNVNITPYGIAGNIYEWYIKPGYPRD